MDHEEPRVCSNITIEVTKDILVVYQKHLWICGKVEWWLDSTGHGLIGKRELRWWGMSLRLARELHEAIPEILTAEVKFAPKHIGPCQLALIITEKITLESDVIAQERRIVPFNFSFDWLRKMQPHFEAAMGYGPALASYRSHEPMAQNKPLVFPTGREAPYFEEQWVPQLRRETGLKL